MKHTEQNIWVKHKKWWIISGGGSLLIILLASLVVWNIVSWQTYEQSYKTWYADLKREVAQVFALPSKTDIEKGKKRAALQDIHKKMQNGIRHCDTYSILYWQQFLPVVKQEMSDCKGLIAKTASFDSALERIVSYLSLEDQTLELFNKASVANLDETSMQQQPQVWEGISEQLGKQQPTKDFAPILELAKAKAVLVRQAWQALVDANSAKDRAKYDEAVHVLAATYDSLGGVGDLSQKTLGNLVSSLEKTYSDAF